MTPAFLHASIEGDIAGAQRCIRAVLPEGWPDMRAVLELRLKQLEADPSLQPWLLRAMVLKDTRIMIGHIGFHGPPGGEHLREWSPAAAEFGYTVFAQYRRRGYARESASALMRWAETVHGVKDFLLAISPDNVASQALAAQLGFVRVGGHLDEVDGPEDVLVRTR